MHGTTLHSVQIPITEEIDQGAAMSHVFFFWVNWREQKKKTKVIGMNQLVVIFDFLACSLQPGNRNYKNLTAT